MKEKHKKTKTEINTGVQKNFFNENEYDKLYPSGSAAARICGTPKMHKFSPSDLFRPIVSS